MGLILAAVNSQIKPIPIPAFPLKGKEHGGKRQVVPARFLTDAQYR